jgi:NADP-dependent 3-hydroxy acid dehydrogenase YdfG
MALGRSAAGGARRFAVDGHAVALLTRRAEFIDRLAAEPKRAKPYACDVGDRASLDAWRKIGDPPEVAFREIHVDLFRTERADRPF